MHFLVVAEVKYVYKNLVNWICHVHNKKVKNCTLFSRQSGIAGQRGIEIKLYMNIYSINALTSRWVIIRKASNDVERGKVNKHWTEDFKCMASGLQWPSSRSEYN